MRNGLAICFLALISVSLLSYSNIANEVIALFNSLLSLITPENLYEFSWLPLFITAVAFYPYMILRQKNKTKKLRSRLASDLHDDLGSILHSVSIYTDLALIKGEAVYIQKIKDSAQEAINGIRDIIWQLDDNDTSFSNLIARVKSFASFLCQVRQISFNVKISNDAILYQLHEEEKRNLYMIIKEAINNSVKHARPDEVTLCISLEKGNPSITISDNGKGYDSSPANLGNGIRNMKMRADCIGYKINIQATTGTVIRLQKK
jgi:signal transduction histidine kinase